MSFLKCPHPRLWIIPAILCAMALVQRYHAEATNMHPWKGGGFGMFAAVPPTHLLTMKTQDGKFFYKTPTPQVLRRAGRVLATHPTPERARDFGRQVLAQEWFLVNGPDGKFPVTKERLTAGLTSTPVILRKATIQISRYTFEKDGCRMVHGPLLSPVTVEK